MRAELIGPNDPRWRDLLERAPHDVYHLPGYGALYEPGPTAKETALYVRGERGELLVPLMLRPLPDLGSQALAGTVDAASPYGFPGPLCFGEFSREERDLLRERVRSLLVEHRVATCFIRAHPLMPHADALLDPIGVGVEHGMVAVVELDRTEEQIWRGYDPEHRRAVMRLREARYDCAIDDWADFDDFLAIYTQTMRRVSAATFYGFDREYFDGLRRVWGPRIHLISVRSPDGEIVAAGINTECGGLVNAHLCGTAAAHVRLSPSKLLWDTWWRWAKARGNKLFNLGGGLGGQRDSLFRFKKGFTASTRPFRTIRIVGDEEVYRAACRAAGVADQRTEFFPSYRQPRPSTDLQPASRRSYPSQSV